MIETIVKRCPKCGQPLKIKVNRDSGHEFLGCTAFFTNGCRYTEALPESIKLRRQGQKGLFDDDVP